MNIAIKAALASFIGLVGFASAPAAWAGCGDVKLTQPASWEETSHADLLQLADYQTSGTTSIIGMWAFKMVAGGSTVDFGYVQWHSDGTELMNSGGRAPATENFCMGVWKQTGPSRYHLNHFALSYDATSGALNAKVNIKEDVALSANGTTFSGPFTLDVYDPNSGALLQHVAGQVTAERVSAN